MHQLQNGSTPQQNFVIISSYSLGTLQEVVSRRAAPGTRNLCGNRKMKGRVLDSNCLMVRKQAFHFPFELFRNLVLCARVNDAKFVFCLPSLKNAELFCYNLIC